MNRRDFIKASVAGTAALTATQAVASPAPINLNPVNRMQRYKEYQDILDHDHSVGEAIMNIAHEAAIAVPECKYAPLENGFTVAYPYVKLFRHAFDLAVFGDLFYELIHDNDPFITRSSPLRQQLPADTMYRIETIKGKLLEFQQSKEGPDYAALAHGPVGSTSYPCESRSVRFYPDQIFQLSIGPSAFYPYGVSLLEPIRKDKSATIGQGAINNFHKIFVEGMAALKVKLFRIEYGPS